MIEKCIPQKVEPSSICSSIYLNCIVYVCLVDLYSAIEYQSLGCYKYIPQNSGLAPLEGKDPDVLDGNYKLRTDAIEKCALAAMKTRNNVFAIQDGGKCLVSTTRTPTFIKHGISQDCKSDGKGASGASHVYLTFGTKGMHGMGCPKPDKAT